MTTARTYPVELTGAQIFGLSDLVRLLGSARTPDGEGGLRQELLDALNEFQRLLPEPSDDDIDAYLAAVRSGELPDWNAVALPLTETAAEWVARAHPEYAPSAKGA